MCVWRARERVRSCERRLDAHLIEDKASFLLKPRSLTHDWQKVPCSHTQRERGHIQSAVLEKKLKHTQICLLYILILQDIGV